MSLIFSLVGNAGVIGLVISSLLSFAVTLSLFSRFSRNGDGPDPETHSGQIKHLPFSGVACWAQLSTYSAWDWSGV